MKFRRMLRISRGSALVLGKDIEEEMAGRKKLGDINLPVCMSWSDSDASEMSIGSELLSEMNPGLDELGGEMNSAMVVV